MTPTEVLQNALDDGVSVSLNGAGKLKITGDENTVNKWLPAIRDNKAAIISALAPPEATGRTWTQGNPYTCKCGDVTGWMLDDEILCPVCYQDKFNPPPEDKAPEAEVSVSKKQDRLRHAKPSPIALEWLQEHKQKLLDSGWTRSELYDRRKYRQGLAWLDLWEQAFSMAYLHEDGTIEFECSRHGRDYFQTARPKRHEGKR